MTPADFKRQTGDTMMTTYYAISHRYGSTACDEHGDHIGTVHEFTSRKQRDDWVADGPAYISAPGCREALRSRNATDRRAIKRYMASK